MHYILTINIYMENLVTQLVDHLIAAKEET